MLWNLSPPQRLFCVVGRLGRKKKRAGARWEVEREKRQEGLPSFPSCHRSPRAIYFWIIAIFIGIPSGEPLHSREQWSFDSLAYVLPSLPLSRSFPKGRERGWGGGGEEQYTGFGSWVMYSHLVTKLGVIKQNKSPYDSLSLGSKYEFYYIEIGP